MTTFDYNSPLEQRSPILIVTHHSLSTQKRKEVGARDVLTVDLQVNIAPAFSRQDFEVENGVPLGV